MATPPVTPEVQVQETPQLPEGFTSFEQRQDGTYAATLADGTTFHGTADEVIKELGKAKVKTADWGKQFKSELESIKSSLPQPQQPAVSPEDMQVRQLREYLANEQAQYLGYANAEEMKRDLSKLKQMSEQTQNQRIAAEFHALAPDFPAGIDVVTDSNGNQTDKNVERMFQAAAKYGIIEFDANNEPVNLTPRKMFAAHRMAVADGMYKPLESQNGTPAQRPAAPPMVPGTQPENPANQYDVKSAWSMPLKELQAKVAELQRRG